MRRALAHQVVAASLFLGIAFAQGGIRTVQDRDAFTDANESRVLVLADQQSAFGRSTAIIWRCDGDTDYELFIATAEFLTTTGTVPIVYRFDTEPSVTARWNHSTDGTAAFVPLDRLRKQFTGSAIAADRLVVGISDFRGTRYEYTFSLAGLEGHLRDLGCIGVDLEFSPHYVRIPIADAYQLVKDAVDGLPYTEDLNVMYFDGLTLHFGTRGVGTVLTFTGTNGAIHERIRAAFD